jgi:5-oxoprolinase (ATP-hydrolysing)
VDQGSLTDTVPSAGWQFWIDRGGTFTDIVAKRPDGSIVTHKLLSVRPDRYRDAALQGIRELLGLPADGPLPLQQIKAVKVGTTLATNALLERRGEPTVLVVTKGLRDLLRIGHQNRPRLFDRAIVLPPALYDSVIEADERVSVDGRVLRAFSPEQLRPGLEAAYAAGIQAVAIVFMHAYAFPDHERLTVQLARTIGFTQVSASHEVSPLMKIVDRGNTTVVDAYLSPVLGRYVAEVTEQLAGARVLFMQSNGGLTAGDRFRGSNGILSGPAAGAVGAARTAEIARIGRVIGFDMGGTSTDVSHYAGVLERTFDGEVAGLRLQTPMMQVHTVAAGGGSVLRFDGQRFRVGPDSAGSDPGPCCYGRGGPLTVTDCNVVVGKILPSFFPRLFGASGEEPIDVHTVRARFDELADQVRAATGQPVTAERVAHGFLEVAVANMAAAIRRISIERGHDATEYTLSCFGGAGPQHACLVADALGVTKIFVHRHAGVLSAYGIGLADRRIVREQALEVDFTDHARPALDAALLSLEQHALTDLQRDSEPGETLSSTRRLHLRYAGSDSVLLIDDGDRDEIVRRFEAAHAQRFGFAHSGRTLVVQSVLVEVVAAAAVETDTAVAAVHDGQSRPREVGRSRLYTCSAAEDIEQTFDAPVIDRDSLPAGTRVPGPALIVEPNSTLVVEPGWCVWHQSGQLLLERTSPPRDRRTQGHATIDPVRLEIFNGLFMSVAEQMGATLERTAQSVNIKERRDFSCALFDASGSLVANAPHIPVHLGSMGDSVQAVMASRAGRMRPGDAFVLNAPYNGGTHLPDLTVVTPVFNERGDQVVAFVGSRGHHADIGGITPGSMPPDSRTIAEEGVVIDDLQLVSGGVFLEHDVRRVLSTGMYPVRKLEQNIADLKAQLAANETGRRALVHMMAHYGLGTVQAFMGYVQDNAEEAIRRVIDTLKDGAFTYRMDNGSVVSVSITIDRLLRRGRIDFTGTSPQLSSNFNAPVAVSKAAVLYVFRTLVDEDIPLNGGCLRPLDIVVPEGSLLNPVAPAAVVAGNVETSQVVVDALFGALGVMAGAQGTMNNLTFGNDRWQYYETICGGAAAGPGFDGASAVQTHMTNSRITDAEILERRFPVVLEEFAIRRGSGGSGRWHGGDGVIRRLRFREPMTAAILSNRRIVPPFGGQGGGAGMPGTNRVERADGSVETLPAAGTVHMLAGDAIVVETPGGGGWGTPL